MGDRSPATGVLVITPAVAGLLAQAAHHFLPVVRADRRGRQIAADLEDARDGLLTMARSGAPPSAQERPNVAAPAEPVDALAVPIPEAARRLGISVNTVRRRVAAGDIAATSIGRRRLIAVAELDRVANGGTPSPCP